MGLLYLLYSIPNYFLNDIQFFLLDSLKQKSLLNFSEKLLEIFNNCIVFSP